MATLYAAADGTLIRYLTTEQEAQFPTPPAATASTLQFDESTNAAIVTGINTEWQSYRLSGGALTHNGQAVTVNAASAAYTQRQQVYQEAQQIVDDLTTYLALGSPTNAQTVTTFREVAQAMRYLIRHFVLGQ